MVGIAQDERGSTSVIGLVLLVAVTLIVASMVAVFVFGIDTTDAENAVENILDMDEYVNSLVPLVVVPLPGLGKRRNSSERIGGRSTHLRSAGRT